MTLAHHSVPILPRPSTFHLPAHSTSLVPSFLNTEHSTLNSELPPVLLTPFLLTLARHAINSCIVYHLQRMGEGVPPPGCRKMTACSLLTPVPTSLLPRVPLGGVAKTPPLSPFPRPLTQKQGGTGYWPALSTVEGSYQSSSLSAEKCQLWLPLPTPCLVPLPASR